LNDKALELFGPTIHTWWNAQDSKKKDELIGHMVNLFDNTFNKKVVTKLADENLKYTRAQYREKLQLDLKHELPSHGSGERVEGPDRGCKGELV
jgi:hypothetical protein